MKKQFLIIFLAILTPFLSTAQDAETTENQWLSKRGVYIFPKAGEFGIGFSAAPILGYAGNFFSGTATNSAPGVNAPSAPNAFALGNVGNAVMFRYMLDDNTAFRGRFQFNLSRERERYVVSANELTPDLLNPQYVEDNVQDRSSVVLLAAGLEKRRGEGRLKGIYGAELLLGIRSNSTVYEYGNPINADFNAPDTYDGAQGTRILEEKEGRSFLVGGRGFVGVEYFFAPKISIGGELGYTLGLRTAGLKTITSETWDPNTNSVVQVEYDTTPSNNVSGVGLGLDALNAGINLFFYF